MSLITASLTWAIFPLGGVGPAEMLVIGVVAVLLFGKRLPEMGRTWGKSLLELRKGLSGIEEELRGITNLSTPAPSRPAKRTFHEMDDRDEATAPKFEPPVAPAAESQEESSPAS
ncbi:MAG: twin-arginine translocase TatA/TatE family subunit [Pirellulales bacterium]|nr:twin-arginine translocase TatA/TatE family subunit [Pirellulales bacterium]